MLLRSTISMNRRKKKKTFQTEQKRSRNRKLERVLQLHPLRPLQVRSLRQRLHRQSSLPRFQLPRRRRNRHSLLKPSYYTQILLIIATPDNEEIATVDSQGNVNGVAAGTTKIHVEGDGLEDYITVAVSEKQIVLESESSSQQGYQSEGGDYVLNTNTMKFHYPSCRHVKTIKSSNRWDYHGDREEVINMGYIPCKTCKP